MDQENLMCEDDLSHKYVKMTKIIDKEVGQIRIHYDFRQPEEDPDLLRPGADPDLHQLTSEWNEIILAGIEKVLANIEVTFSGMRVEFTGMRADFTIREEVTKRHNIILQETK